MNSLPKTVTRQRRDCDLNPGPSAPEPPTVRGINANVCMRVPSASLLPPLRFHVPDQELGTVCHHNGMNSMTPRLSNVN